MTPVELSAGTVSIGPCATLITVLKQVLQDVLPQILGRLARHRERQRAWIDRARAAIDHLRGTGLAGRGIGRAAEHPRRGTGARRAAEETKIPPE